jgi:hypothetical protein
MIIKRNIKPVIAILVTFAATTFYLPGSTIAAVSPSSWDFGEVDLGSSETATVRIYNPGTLDIYLTTFRFGQTDLSDFSVNTTIPQGGILLQTGQIAEIEIVYTPSDVGATNDTLYIYTNPRGYEETVALSGAGRAVELLPSQPETISVEDILSFFDGAVDRNLVENDSAYLKGKGKGKSAPNRLNALRNMIRSAGEMIKDENTYMACNQLFTVLKKIDGQGSPGSPPDFVEGDGTTVLAGMIEALIEQLECN